MAADPISKLSEAQKECLRLVHLGYEGKEIAKKLGLSPHAVIERLRAARRTLGVGSSREAARILIFHEGPMAYNRHVDMPLGIVSAPAPGANLHPSIERGGSAGVSKGCVRIREDQAPYSSGDENFPVPIPWPFPVRGRKRNDLTASQTLVVTLALTIGVAIAALVAIAIVDQLSKLRLG
jgi:DNA-binding CsgD family transcriptional regulator